MDLYKILEEKNYKDFKVFIENQSEGSIMWVWNYIQEDDVRIYRNDTEGLFKMRDDFLLTATDFIKGIAGGNYNSLDRFVTCDLDGFINSYPTINSFIKNRLAFIFVLLINSIEYSEIFIKRMVRHSND